MSKLSVSEIQKRDGRIEILLDKLAKNDVFETSRGKIKASLLYWYPRGKSVVVLDPSDKAQFKEAQKILNNANSSDKFHIVSGTQLAKFASLTELIKTPEFGGRGIGGGVVAESRALKALTTDLESSIQENKGPIGISIKNDLIPDVVGLQKTPGTPKSDFHFIDSSGKPVIWISHKDGRSAKDFQQWGGISERKEPNINRHRETQKFIDDLKNAYPNGVGAESSQPKSLYRKIIDDKLKMMSIYGNEYFTARYGPQNVTILLQGPPGLKKLSLGRYRLVANHVHVNGESMDRTEFEPVFMAIHKGDRNDAGLKATRVVISPIAGRNAVEFPPLPV